jgi:hypothetical protein
VGVASYGAARRSRLRHHPGLTLGLACEPSFRDLARLARKPHIYRLRRARAPCSDLSLVTL